MLSQGKGKVTFLSLLADDSPPFSCIRELASGSVTIVGERPLEPLEAMNSRLLLLTKTSTMLSLVIALTGSLHAQVPTIHLEKHPIFPEITLRLSEPLGPNQFLQQSCDLQHWGLIGANNLQELRLPVTRRPRYFRTVNKPAASGGTYFEVLRALKLALEESPDHLVRRAEDAVASRSALKIYEFVRDHIANYPPDDFGFSDTNTLTAMRWGTAATLRGGAGTPREKCQLLLEMLEDAGFEARLRRGAPDIFRLNLRSILSWRPERRFAPCLDVDMLARGLGLDLEADPNLGDANLEAAVLLAGIEPLLDPESNGKAFDWTLPAAIPFVEVLQNDAWEALNPLVPNGRFGESYTDGETRSLTSSPRLPDVLIKVEAAPASSPHSRITLLSKRWKADVVAGRQLTLAFQPTGDFEDILRSKINDLTTFVPTLTLQGAGIPATNGLVPAAAGKPFSITGDLYEIDESTGTVRLGDSDLGDPEAQEGLINQVTDVRIDGIDALRFPMVRVSVSATRRDGSSVNGLGAEAFELFEEGFGQTVSMQRNNNIEPSMVILLDSSGSVDDAAQRENRQLAETVATHFLERYENLNARVRVAAVSTRTNFAGGWFNNPALLEERLQTAADQAFGSDLWTALSQLFTDARPTVVLFVTDGQATDELTPAIRRAIQIPSVPVYTVGFGDTDEGILRQISDLTNGNFHVGSSVSAIDHSLNELIDSQITTNYVLRYIADEDGLPNRNVRLGFDDGRLQASSSYTVPAVEEHVPASGIAGLYLTIRIDGRESSRTLAGWSEALLGVIGSQRAPTDADLLEVHSMLFGSVTMAFEGAPPLFSVWYEEWLSQQLAYEPLFNAVAAGNADHALAQLRKGNAITPIECYLLNAVSMQAERSDALAALPTYETQMRLTSVIEKPSLNGQHLPTRQTDLNVLGRWVTAADDPATAYRATLKRTAKLNVMEAALMQQTAGDVLAGDTLTRHAGRVNSSHYGDPHGRDWAAITAPFGKYDLLLPSDGAATAFWAIDKETGTLIGVLRDGTGGGLDETDRYFEGIDRALDLAGKISTLFQFSSFGAWVKLEQTKAKIMKGVIKFIATGEGSTDSILLEPAAEYACGEIRDAIAGGIPIRSLNSVVTNYRTQRERVGDMGKIFGFNNFLPDIPLPGCNLTP